MTTGIACAHTLSKITDDEVSRRYCKATFHYQTLYKREQRKLRLKVHNRISIDDRRGGDGEFSAVPFSKEVTSIAQNSDWNVPERRTSSTHRHALMMGPPCVLRHGNITFIFSDGRYNPDACHRETHVMGWTKKDCPCEFMTRYPKIPDAERRLDCSPLNAWDHLGFDLV
ncbi:hypothetical protein CPB84DRAFT_1771486 [Gymnopilus junonius]|uniref:Uncharacterized protein n=1 Tax=Gymnopilus junonius TaxID=109634 RepID=A0A9P5NSS5_GYMJU|nr:hypothetical protein CPB84DRAFT_1771486 [Gymnopilus junonius]